MTTGASDELLSFYHFLSRQLHGDDRSMSPEQALDLWRSDHPSGEVDVETVSALREAILDMEAGDRGQSLEDFDREFRHGHSLETRS